VNGVGCEEERREKRHGLDLSAQSPKRTKIKETIHAMTRTYVVAKPAEGKLARGDHQDGGQHVAATHAQTTGLKIKIKVKA
jgi:hypothetical protein